MNAEVTTVYPEGIQWHTHHIPMQCSLEEILLMWVHTVIGPRCRALSKKAQWPSETPQASYPHRATSWAESPTMLLYSKEWSKLMKELKPLWHSMWKMKTTSRLIFMTTSVKPPLREKQSDTNLSRFHISLGIDARPPGSGAWPLPAGLGAPIDSSHESFFFRHWLGRGERFANMKSGFLHGKRHATLPHDSEKNMFFPLCI